MTSGTALAGIGLTLLWAAARAVASDSSPEGLDADGHGGVDARMVRSTASYVVPDVTLVRDDGQAVRFAEELDPGRTVVLSFIYTTCTTICPVTSATLGRLQHRLGAARSQVQIVSVSLDPEQDTPARLVAYARKFGAGPFWRHYTGSADASFAVQRAFDAYRGDKMNHAPDTYIRRAGSHAWVRIAGFASVDDLLKEIGSIGGTPSQD